MAPKRKSLDTIRRHAADRRKSESPEQRALRLEKGRIRAAVRRSCESEEERAKRLAQGRARIKKTRESLKLKEKKFNLQQKLCYSKDTNNINIFNLSKTNNMSANKAFLLSEGQRAKAAKREAERRSCETAEQRAARLEKCRIRSALLRANEDGEARAVRLARERIRVRAARFRQHLNLIALHHQALMNNQVKSGQLDSAESSQQQFQDKNNTIFGINMSPHGSYLQHLQEQIARNACKLLKASIPQNHMAHQFASHSDSANQQWPEFEVSSSNHLIKSGVDIECEVTIEEDDRFLFKEEAEKISFPETVLCEPVNKDNRLFIKQEEKEIPLPETVLCEPMNKKVEDSRPEDCQNDKTSEEVKLEPINNDHLYGNGPLHINEI